MKEPAIDRAEPPRPRHFFQPIDQHLEPARRHGLPAARRSRRAAGSSLLLLVLVLVCACGSQGSGAQSGGAAQSVEPAVDLTDLRQAYAVLLGQAIEQPTSPALLGAAWNGLLAEAKQEGLIIGAATLPALSGSAVTNFQTFAQAFGAVKVNSHSHLDPVKLNYAAIDAMARSLHDTHTTFFPPSDLTLENRRNAGDDGTSVGMRIQRTTNPPPEVLEVVAGSAAAQAGVHAGDTLLEVNGRPIQSWSLPDLSRQLNGPDGTRLELGVRRAGSARLQKFTVVRRTISLDIVSSRILPGNVGYLRIREFPDQDFGIRQVDQAMGDFADAGVQGVILDLRGNPGGNVGTLQPIASRFVSQDPLALLQGRQGTVQALPRVGPFSLHTRYVVLVDDGSASSSELLARAVQDYHDGLIVGSHSCGCLMEAVDVTLPDQKTGMEVAVARVESPVGHVQTEGNPIIPDTVVPADGRLLEQGRDPQLEAGLRALGVDSGTAATVTYARSQGD